jgi:hypothetical protein
MPWFRRLVASTSLRRSVFDNTSVRVRSVADKVALEQVSLRVFRFSPATILQLTLFLPAGQMGEAWEPPQSDAISDISEYWIGKHIFGKCMVNCYYKLTFFDG